MEQHNQSQQPPVKKFYQKTWFTVLLLILFWPAGLFFMWKYAEWSRVVKIIITVILVVICIYGFLNRGNDDRSRMDTENIETTAETTEPSMTKEATKATTEVVKETTRKTTVAQSKESRMDEMAFRAAVVSLTNIMAADVFDDNGSVHDTSKYHSYSDTSGDSQRILSEGMWTEIGDNSWHVDDLKLINQYDTIADASLDVKRDGDNYIVSNVKGLWAKEGKEEYGTELADVVKQGDAYKALTVPMSLIEADR